MPQQPQQLLVLDDDDHAKNNEEEECVDLLPLPSPAALHGPEIAQTIAQFQKSYSCDPAFVTRAPGRVNIIGEHIDYNGFGVLPMALEQSVFVAAAATLSHPQEDNDICLDIQSTSPGAEPRHYTYKVDKLLVSPGNTNSALAVGGVDPAPFDASGKKDWSHYVLCAFFGVLEELQSQHSWRGLLRGQRFLLLIHGTVPQGAGVSSSSALVVSSALAVLALIHSLQQQKQQQQPIHEGTRETLSLSRPQIAHLCARCERWVGTEGGGMDQAISLFAQAGSGRYIQFQPTFRHKAIPLPGGGSWVVCHSLEESHKRQDAATLFNKRVVECKIGCRLLADALQWKQHHPQGYRSSLWELVGKSGMSLIDLENVVRGSIVEKCSKDELMSLVLPDKAIASDATSLTEKMQHLAADLGIVRNAGIEVLEVADSFLVRDRLLHVLSETRRVQEFVSCSCEELTSGQGDTSTTVLQTLGILLTHSHRSCSKLYDCSSAQVDRLQQVCLQAPGAVGSRMTGAGWGGCVISLVETVQVEGFCNHVREHYYESLPSGTFSKSTNNEADYLFVTQPSQGSQVFIVGKSGDSLNR